MRIFSGVKSPEYLTKAEKGANKNKILGENHHEEGASKYIEF